MDVVAKLKEFVAEEKGQTAIEYILLIALGLFILLIGFALAFYVNEFGTATTASVDEARKDTLTMLLH
jgi:Flp pilus assembly pilin Flp